MPTATNRRQKSHRQRPPQPAIPIDTLDEDRQLSEDELSQPGEWEGPWRERIQSDNMDFFDGLSVLPKRAQDECLIYLYRLEPPVKNQHGEPSYIDLCPASISLGQIKQEHGGGKFEAWLKRGPRTIQKKKFWIDGEPRYKAGQTDTNGRPVANVTVAGTGPVNRSEMAEVVKEVLKVGNSAGQDAAIDVMANGMKRVMELQTTMLTAQVGSATGNKITDELLPKLLERAMAPAPAPPTLAEQLVQLKALAELFRPEPAVVANPATVADPIATMNTQLGFVKELLGVDSISDLMQGRGRVETPPWWAGAATRAIEILPGLMDRWSQTQMAIANSGRATPMRPTLAGTNPQPTAATPINTTAPAPTPQPTQEDAIRIMVSEVCRAFDGGFDGFQAAAHLELSMPQALAVFKPMLLNPTELSNFVAQVPPLAERAAQPEWAEFQRDFVQGLAEEPIQHEPPKASAPQAAAS